MAAIEITQEAEDLHATLAVLSYFAGREELYSRADGFIATMDILIAWAKEFDALHTGTDWDEEEEPWDDQVHTFLFEKIQATMDRYQWTQKIKAN